MQTKLKPILLLVMLAATGILLYAASDVRAQNPAIGIFDVSAITPQVISINPKLGQPHEMAPVDTTVQQLQPEVQRHLPAID